MSREFKQLDDARSAVANGTPFRVTYFIQRTNTLLRNEHLTERTLYFKTRDEAFEFAQNHSGIENISIQNLETREVLFPRKR